jgi:hypothetical protein
MGGLSVGPLLVELIRNRPFGWWLGVAESGPSALDSALSKADVPHRHGLWSK